MVCFFLQGDENRFLLEWEKDGCKPEDDMNIGVIGLGRLGGALVRGLAGKHSEDSVYGYNRTQSKALVLEKQCPGFRSCGSAAGVLELCDIVFLWMKPADAAPVLDAHAGLIAARRTLLVSCAPNVPLRDYTPRWAECLPNVNMAVGKGVTVIHHAPALSERDRMHVEGILARVGTVYASSAGDMLFYSALCSCGPALYATMAEMLADVLAARRGYDRELCRRMVRETVLGTMILQEGEGADAAEVVHRVAHPGGSTEGGVKHLAAVLPGMYEDMLKAMKKW